MNNDRNYQVGHSKWSMVFNFLLILPASVWGQIVCPDKTYSVDFFSKTLMKRFVFCQKSKDGKLIKHGPYREYDDKGGLYFSGQYEDDTLVEKTTLVKVETSHANHDGPLQFSGRYWGNFQMQCSGIPIEGNFLAVADGKMNVQGKIMIEGTTRVLEAIHGQIDERGTVSLSFDKKVSGFSINCRLTGGLKGPGLHMNSLGRLFCQTPMGSCQSEIQIKGSNYAYGMRGQGPVPRLKSMADFRKWLSGFKGERISELIAFDESSRDRVNDLRKMLVERTEKDQGLFYPLSGKLGQYLAFMHHHPFKKKKFNMATGFLILVNSADGLTFTRDPDYMQVPVPVFTSAMDLEQFLKEMEERLQIKIFPQ